MEKAGISNMKRKNVNNIEINSSVACMKICENSDIKIIYFHSLLLEIFIILTQVTLDDI